MIAQEAKFELLKYRMHSKNVDSDNPFTEYLVKLVDADGVEVHYNITDYYNDSDLKPEEQLFFSITIVPFGKTNSPNIN